MAVLETGNMRCMLSPVDSSALIKSVVAATLQGHIYSPYPIIPVSWLSCMHKRHRV